MKYKLLVKNISLFLVLSIISFASPTFAKENRVASATVRAENLFQQGKYREAITIYDRIIPSLKQEQKAIAYYNLAVAENRIDSKISAIQNLQKAIPLLEKVSTEKYIIANLFLSQLFLEQGILAEAEPILKATIPLAERENKSNSEAIGRSLLGNLNLRFDRYEEAIEQYRFSWEIAKNPTTLISLSQAFWQRGDRTAAEVELVQDLAEKERLKQAAKQDFEAGYQAATKAISNAKTSENKISSRINLLKYFSQFVSRSEAENIKNEAIDLLNELPDSAYQASSWIALAQISNDREALRFLSRSRAIANKIDAPEPLALALENIGKINLDRNNLATAKSNTESAILISEKTVNSERLFFQFWQLAKIQLALGNADAAIDAYGQALWNLQSNRGEFTAGNNNLLFYLQEEAQPFLREYITQLLSSPNQERIRTAIDILGVLKLSDLQSYFNDPCFEILFQVDELERKKIPENRANIYEFIAEDRLFLILETQDNYVLRSVDISKEDLEAKVKEYRQILVIPTGSAFVQPSKELYNILIAPLINEIPRTVTKLSFSRDGEIENIPLETLIDSEDNYLIEKYQIAYSAGLETNLIPNNDRGEKIIFGLSESQIQTTLRFATQEVRAIAETIKGGETFLDREFTKNALSQTIQQEDISFLHIATHGSFQGTAKNSYLEAFDSKISLNSFKNFLLSARQPMNLLTLSGCETAIGNERAILGFAGVSVRARIPNVIGSVWSIPDNVTAILMEEFYRNLSLGKTVPEAKQIAQLRIIELGENPRSWAGIILITN
ncbi:MAG: CHAT domain-containing protein [Prochloraceae cyanobacterium]